MSCFFSSNVLFIYYQVSNDAAVGDPVGIVTVIDPDNSGTVQGQTHSCIVGGEGVGIFTVENAEMLLKASSFFIKQKEACNFYLHHQQ